MKTMAVDQKRVWEIQKQARQDIRDAILAKPMWQKVLIGVALLLFGTVGTTTNLFAPVHELGHLFAAFISGGDGYFVSWNEVRVSGPLVDFVRLGGPWIGGLFWVLLTNVGMSKNKWWIFAFALGGQIGNQISEPFVTDFKTDAESNCWLTAFIILFILSLVRASVLWVKECRRRQNQLKDWIEKEYLA